MTLIADGKQKKNPVTKTACFHHRGRQSTNSNTELPCVCRLCWLLPLLSSGVSLISRRRDVRLYFLSAGGGQSALFAPIWRVEETKKKATQLEIFLFYPWKQKTVWRLERACVACTLRFGSEAQKKKNKRHKNTENEKVNVSKRRRISIKYRRLIRFTERSPGSPRQDPHHVIIILIFYFIETGEGRGRRI